MNAVRKVYDSLPARITTPQQFQHRKTELNLLPLDEESVPATLETEVPEEGSILLLAGGMENSKWGGKDPVGIQRELRNEWD